MKKKRQIVVDKKFQFGLAASLTIVSAAVISILIVIFALAASDNDKKLQKLSTNQQALTKNQNEMLKTLIKFSKMKDKNDIKFSMGRINNDMNSNKKRMDQNNSILLEIGKSNYNLIRILIAFIVIQSVILFYILIRRSHRISGPIFLINRYINEIKDGKFPEIRPLRTKDDFKEMFDNFRDMVEYLKMRS